MPAGIAVSSSGYPGGVTDARDRDHSNEHADFVADGDELDDLDADELVEGAKELFEAPADSPASDTKTPPPG